MSIDRRQTNANNEPPRPAGVFFVAGRPQATATRMPPAPVADGRDWTVMSPTVERVEHHRRLLVAVVLAVLALVVGVGVGVDAHASSSGGQVAGTRVAAHELVAGPVVAASDKIAPGESRWSTTDATDDAIGSRVAPQTAGRAAGLADDGVNVIPSSGRTFVGTPRGAVYDIPEGWEPWVADNGRGIVYSDRVPLGTPT